MSSSSEPLPCPAGKTLLRRSLVLLALPLVPALIAGFWHPRRPDFHQPEIGSLRYEQARTLQVLWVDARPQKDFEKGHAPGALSLNHENYEAQLPHLIEAWKPGQLILVYCEGGACQSSKSIARKLKQDLGDCDVRILEGGWHP